MIHRSKGAVCLIMVWLCSGSAAFCADDSSYTTQVRGRENPEAISAANATFAFYQEIIELQKRRPEEGLGVARLRTVVDIDEKTALAFIAYARNAIEESNSYNLTLHDSIVCRNSKALNSASSLATSMDRVESETDAHRAEYVANSAAILGNENKARLDLYVKRKVIPNMTETRVDYSRRMAALNQKPGDVIAKSCNQTVAGNK